MRVERENTAEPISAGSVHRYSDAVAALAMALIVLGVDPVEMPGQDALGAWSYAALVGVLVWSWPILGAWCGLYGSHEQPTRDAALRIARVAALSAVFPVLYAVMIPGKPMLASGLLFWSGTIAGAVMLRFLIRWTIVGAGESLPRQVVIVGSGPRAMQLHRQLRKQSAPGVEVVGIVDDRDFGLGTRAGLPLLGGPAELETILMHRVVDEVLIALPIKSSYSAIQQVITACERSGTQSKFVADIFRCSVARPRLEQGGQVPVINNRIFVDDYRLGLKRILDILIALAALALLAPVLLAVAAAVRLSSPGPVIFRQERYGLNKRRFHILKFRTMVVDAEARQAELEDRNEASGPVFKMRWDPRVTRVGAFLRRTSLDELPQLWNVLRGDMSLVGPRPLPLRDVGRFEEPWLMRRFSVRPGVTCLWQIGGRQELSFDDWVALDLQYIDAWSLRLDLRILARTVPAVIAGRGAM